MAENVKMTLIGLANGQESGKGGSIQLSALRQTTNLCIFFLFFFRKKIKQDLTFHANCLQLHEMPNSASWENKDILPRVGRKDVRANQL